MARCANCNAELQPTWKFCIFCGTPVDPAGESPSRIPAAIRPPSVAEPSPRRRVDIPLILGIALGVGGVALVVYLIVTFGGAT